MTHIAEGSFEIRMTPGDRELEGAINRFEISKTFAGDVRGTGIGVMLSAGDPRNGTAGYVAMETFRGHVGEREGGFALQQFGTMNSGSRVQHYEVVPGSGSGQLAGISGALRVDDGDEHRYRLEYAL